MKVISPSLLILTFLLAILPHNPAMTQGNVHQLTDIINLPAELNFSQDSSCTIEFREEWIINAAAPSISKEVNAYCVTCGKDSVDLSAAGEIIRIKKISYEFSFLDSHPDEAVRGLREDIIALVQANHPLPRVYKPEELLLSVYFHEEWVFDPGKNEIRKSVRGISPVIWQQRQTTDGEAVPDAETGLPVYYKLRLEKIDLRKP